MGRGQPYANVKSNRRDAYSRGINSSLWEQSRNDQKTVHKTARFSCVQLNNNLVRVDSFLPISFKFNREVHLRGGPCLYSVLKYEIAFHFFHTATQPAEQAGPCCATWIYTRVLPVCL